MLLQPLAVLSCFDDGLAFFEGCWPVLLLHLLLPKYLQSHCQVHCNGKVFTARPLSQLTTVGLTEGGQGRWHAVHFFVVMRIHCNALCCGVCSNHVTQQALCVDMMERPTAVSVWPEQPVSQWIIGGRVEHLATSLVSVTLSEAHLALTLFTGIS